MCLAQGHNTVTPVRLVRSWYEIRDELVPIFHSMKFMKCGICGSIMPLETVKPRKFDLRFVEILFMDTMNSENMAYSNDFL